MELNEHLRTIRRRNRREEKEKNGGDSECDGQVNERAYAYSTCGLCVLEVISLKYGRA